MRKQLVTVAAGIIVSVGALTACGGGKSSSGSATTEASGGTSEAAYCAQVKEYKATADSFDAVMQSDNAADIRKGFEAMQDLVHKLDQNPPSSIAADVHSVRTLTDEIIAVFDKYDYDFTKLAAAPEFAELSKKMDGGELSAASDRLDKWGQDVCGIAPDTTAASSAS